jgi:hypothetical protein
MMLCIRSFATGLFFGIGALVAFILYQAVSTAFWYYVATTAMDYGSDGSSYDREVQLIHYPDERENYEHDCDRYLDTEDGVVRFRDRWLATECLRDSLRSYPRSNDRLDDLIRPHTDPRAD